MAMHATKYEWAAWGLMAAALIFTLSAKLLPALLAGLLVYELVVMLSPRFVGNKLSHSRAKMVVVALISATVLAALIGAVLGAIAYYKAEGGSYAALLKNMAEIIENSRDLLPPWIAEYLPQGDESQIRATLSEWLRTHAQEIRTIGGSAGHALAMVVVGLIIGSFVSLNEGREHHSLGPLAQAMNKRVLHLGQAFRKVVFAQVRISLLNTTLTGLYLAVVLPAFGVELPFVKTMIVITFVVGLLPVLGNCLRLARIPGHHPQARILRERAHHRRPDQGLHLGTADRDAGDGGGLRRCRRDRRAGVLRLHQARAWRAGSDLICPGLPRRR